MSLSTHDVPHAADRPSPSTVNHDRWRRAHLRALATPGIAPGPPLPRRRRGRAERHGISPLTLLAAVTIGALLWACLIGLAVVPIITAR